MKKRTKLLLYSGLGFFSLLSLAGPTFAVSLVPPAQYTPLGAITIETAIPGIIQILLFAAFIVSMIFIMIGGLRWILAGGDKAAAESARGTLTGAIIGLIIVLSTWGILNILEALFGINIIGASITLPRL